MNTAAVWSELSSLVTCHNKSSSPIALKLHYIFLSLSPRPPQQQNHRAADQEAQPEHFAERVAGMVSVFAHAVDEALLGQL